MTVSNSHILIKTEEELNSLRHQYGVTNVDSLADYLWFEYGVTLIDDRPKAIFSQVNAQHSPEFHNEEMSQSEYLEILEKRNIYGIGHGVGKPS